MIQASDINFYYSDGQTGGAGNNCLPENSLGGDPTNCKITSTINNLFESLTTEQAQEGRVDFKCFYIFNDSYTDTLPGIDIYFDNQLDGNPELSMGINISNDVQQITIAASVASSVGHMVLGFDTLLTGNINNTSSVGVFATNIQTQLNNLETLSNVSVVGQDFTSYQVYTITFSGQDGNRYQPIITLNTNSLLGSPAIEIAKLVNGSPINSIAPVIVSPLDPPAGINFTSSSAVDRIALNVLKSLDGFPVWVKRVVPVNAAASDSSGATFKLEGVPF